MTNFISARTRKPAAYAAAGAIWIAAWAYRGGPTWWISILSAVSTIVLVISCYVRGGRDSDEGALAGSRADERQKLLSVRSRALVGNAAVIVSFGGLACAVAVWASWWWPFALMFVISIFAYLFGLSNFGLDDVPPEETSNQHHPSSAPVS